MDFFFSRSYLGSDLWSSGASFTNLIWCRWLYGSSESQKQRVFEILIWNFQKEWVRLSWREMSQGIQFNHNIRFMRMGGKRRKKINYGKLSWIGKENDYMTLLLLLKIVCLPEHLQHSLEVTIRDLLAVCKRADLITVEMTSTGRNGDGLC